MPSHPLWWVIAFNTGQEQQTRMARQGDLADRAFERVHVLLVDKFATELAARPSWPP